MKNLGQNQRRDRRGRLALTTMESRIVPAAAFAVTPANALIRFDTASPGTISRSVPLSGLQGGDTIAGIDFRISTGQLIGLGIRNTPGPDEGRIYRIEPGTGVCTLIGGPFSTTLADGASYGFEVDPVHDTLRVVNSARQNLDVSLINGSLISTDTDIHFSSAMGVDPKLVAIANRGGFNPGTHPLLDVEGIDTATNYLVRFGAITADENLGSISQVLPLGVTPVNDNIGFDYVRHGGHGFATIPTAEGTGLYALTSSGTVAFTLVGMIGGTTSAGLTGFSIAPDGFDSVRAVGADAGGSPEVRVFDTQTGALKFDFMAYDAAFKGGVRVAVGDVNGDSVPDIITAPGPGGGPHIRVFDGRTGLNITERAGNFLAYEPTFTGGVFVAAVENADASVDIVTTPDVGGGPLVRRFNQGAQMLSQVMAFDAGSRSGARISMGDYNGDGFPDYVVGSGPGMAPRVRVLSGAPAAPFAELANFLAYNANFLGGVYVSAANVSGETSAEIITGPGAGGGPHIRVFGSASSTPIREFLAYDGRFTGGVRVGASDVNSDGRQDILTGPGPGGGPDVRGYDGTTGALLKAFLAFDPGFLGGVFVGGDPR
jgi:hypothetical protein